MFKWDGAFRTRWLKHDWLEGTHGGDSVVVFDFVLISVVVVVVVVGVVKDSQVPMSSVSRRTSAPTAPADEREAHFFIL
jgi:hypothetical protein